MDNNDKKFQYTYSVKEHWTPHFCFPEINGWRFAHRA